MNLHTVATEISERLATLPGLLAAYVGPPASVSVPCSVIAWPESIDFHGTYGRGMSRIEDWPVLVLAGKADQQESLERLGLYAGTSGAGSVVTVLESKDADLYDPYESCHEVIVKNCTFDVITWQKQDFQGAIFTLDVVGSGQ